MSTLVKNQHYVWRSYLQEWKNSKGNVACYMQKEKRLFETRSENIGVERFFYKLERLTDLELSWVYSLADKASDPLARAMHRETIEIFQFIFKWRENLDNTRISPDKRAILEKHLDNLEKTLGEH